MNEQRNEHATDNAQWNHDQDIKQGVPKRSFKNHVIQHPREVRKTNPLNVHIAHLVIGKCQQQQAQHGSDIQRHQQGTTG